MWHEEKNDGMKAEENYRERLAKKCKKKKKTKVGSRVRPAVLVALKNSEHKNQNFSFL